MHSVHWLTTPNWSKQTPNAIWNATAMRTLTIVDGIQIADSSICLSDSITTLGLTVDRNLTFNRHVANMVKSMHYHTRALRYIRPALTDEMAQSVAVALVQSRLDYANSLLFNTSCQIRANCKACKTSLHEQCSGGPLISRPLSYLNSCTGCQLFVGWNTKSV